MNVLYKKGFTLIELLVVISIMALLSSIVMSGLSNARSKARDSKRIQDMVQIRTALELYRTSVGSYPSTGTFTTPTGIGTHWRGNCSGFGSHSTTGATGYIPNLAPTYISVLPLDPKPISNGTCYVYTSNGTDYMFIVYLTVEGTVPTSLRRPAYPNEKNYTIYTPGASAW